MNLRPAAVAAVFLLACAVSANADPREDALKAVTKCASLVEDHARLACYDAAAKQAKDAMATPPPAEAVAAAPIQTPTPAQPAAKQEESWFGLPAIFGGNGNGPQTTPEKFGSERLPPPPPPPPAPGQPAPPEPIDSISAVVTDIATHLDGRFIVFLDNGQVWQQIKGDDDTAHFKKGEPNKVTISRGFLGSYNLQIQGLTGIFKVSRLK